MRAEGMFKKSRFGVVAETKCRMFCPLNVCFKGAMAK